MGFVSSTNENKVSISFYTKNVSVVNGVPQSEAWTLVKAVDGLMWNGTQNLTLTNDKLKTNVEGAISIDYDSTIAAIEDNSRFVVDSKNYRILHIDNVGMQNEVLQILWKRESSN